MKHNKIERLKTALAPAAFVSRIDSLDLNALSEEDRFYLKNYGIYNTKLHPEVFMLRIRIAGGRVSLSNLESIYHVARTYGLRLLFTARAQIELHGLDANNVLPAWRYLQQAGVTTLQTLTDNFRSIVTDPYDGVSRTSRIEVFPLISQMQSLFLDNPEWMGMLPRKFNTAICGTEAHFTHFFGNDLYFALAQKEGAWGFNLYLGGKNSESAQDADIFVLPSEVPAMFEAVAKAYRTFGLRGSRAKTRLYHLLEEIGMAGFVQKIEAFYPYTMRSAGVRKHQKCAFTPYEPLDEGGFGYCVQTAFGELALSRFKEVLTYVKEEGLTIRLGVDQNLYLLGLREKRVPFASHKGASHITACAGSRYCALSLWDIKQETVYLPLEKIVQHQIQVGFSGCLKGCGRHHHCDIGLVGLRTNSFGKTQKAARVFLGGEYSTGKAVARLIFPSVPLPYLRTLLEKIIEAYEVSGEGDFESFSANYLNPHTTFFVMLWFLAQLYLNNPPKLEKQSEAALYQKLLACEDFPVYADDENYLQSIKTMMHALWDDA